jgi:hypothetical protein
MGRNIEKVKKLIAGVGGQGSIRVGYTPKSVSMRKEGEEWVDARGRRWEIKDGKRKQITKIPPRGFDKCNDCEKLILKTLDQDTYNRMQRCYHCQLYFETELKREGKWEDWVKEMETKRWEAVLAEYESEMKLDENSKGAFDKTVANAIANHEHRK